MPKLPFSGFPGAAHYQIHRDVLRLRYRFPWQEGWKIETSPYRASRNEKRVFLAWARRFLVAGGQPADDWTPEPEVDALELTKLDEALELGEAVRRYLADCECGNAWMPKRSPETLATVTRPVLLRLVAALGERRPLASISQRELADFVRDLGGRKETKQRRLCPISSLFTWALREEFLSGKHPALGIVFWREDDERPHDGVRKSYSAEEFARLLDAARTDPLALDAILLGRYLGLRLQDAVELRWEDWKWDQLLVAVRRRKTRHRGVEVSLVDLHPELVARYADRRGQTGPCLVHQGRVTAIAWPSEAELRRRVEASNYSAVGRELGVSGVAVRKRLERLGAPPLDPAARTVDAAYRKSLASTISQKVERVTRQAGLYERGIQPYHVLRHSFASDSLRAGAAPATVAQELGISVETLMKHYFHAIPRGELDARRANRWGLEPQDLEVPARDQAKERATRPRNRAPSGRG